MGSGKSKGLFKTDGDVINATDGDVVNAEYVPANGHTSTAEESPRTNQDKYTSNKAQIGKEDALPQIDGKLSAADNAINLLQQVTNRSNIGPQEKKIIEYALKVLKSDHHANVVPEELLDTKKDEEGTQEGRKSAGKRGEMAVREWLRADFTHLQAKRKVTTFRSVGMSVFGSITIKGKRKGSTFEDSKLYLHEMEAEAGQTPLVPMERWGQVRERLKGMNSWSFDVFEFEELTGGHALPIMAWFVLHQWGFVEELCIDQWVLRKWLMHVTDCYQNNPYHNATHAADVMQTVHFMIETARVADFISAIEVFALIIAALVHDLGHDGLNNNFHKNAMTDRAISHNDISIQENYHASSLFKDMKEDASIDILQGLNPQQRLHLRRAIIELLLSTDMSKHFTKMKEFKNTVDSAGTTPSSWLDHSQLLMEVVLHVCDISNPAKPFPLAKQWAERCLTEFFVQGDQERGMGLPISPGCDRNTSSLETSQIGFINFVVLPTFQTLGTLLPVVANVCVPTIEDNLAGWEQHQALTRGGSASSTEEEESK